MRWSGGGGHNLWYADIVPTHSAHSASPSADIQWWDALILLRRYNFCKSNLFLDIIHTLHITHMFHWLKMYVKIYVSCGSISAFSSRKYPSSASVSLVEQKLSDEMRQWRFTNHLLPHCCHHPWKEPVNAIHCGGSVIHSRLPIATISHHNCWDIYNFKIHVSQIVCLGAYLSGYPSSFMSCLSRCINEFM